MLVKTKTRLKSTRTILLAIAAGAIPWIMLATTATAVAASADQLTTDAAGDRRFLSAGVEMALGIGVTSQTVPSFGAKHVDKPSANIRVHPVSSNHQNEPSIDIFGNQVIAAFHDINSTPVVKLGYSYSSDLGLTWTNNTLPLLPGYTMASDPSVAFDGAGNAYYGGLFINSSNNSAIAVTKSTNFGATWGSYSTVDTGIGANDFDDKPYVATNPYNQRVYMSYVNFIPSASKIIFSGSSNAAASWTAPSPTIISDAGTGPYNQGPVPAAGTSANDVYVAWWNISGNKIMVDKSANGGTSFNALGSDKAAASGVTRFPPIVSGSLDGLVGEYGNFRLNNFPSLSVDRTYSKPFLGLNPYFGYVYITWADYRNGNGDIWFSRSTDGGTTWSLPLKVNDDITTPARDQFFPWLDVADGIITIAWYDRRASHPRFDVYVAHSHNGGASFSPNIKVSTVASTNIPPWNNRIGDYIGLATRKHNNFGWGWALPVWMDTRNGGDHDVYTSRVEQGYWGTRNPNTGINNSWVAVLAGMAALSGAIVLKSVFARL